MKTTALWAVLAVTLAGCVSAPPAVDPFAGLDGAAVASPSLKELTAAVFVSKNTENTLEYARSHGVARSRGTFGPKTQAFIAELASDFLPKTFKSAVRIARMDDAAAAHADVVVVLDVKAEGGIRAWQDTWYDVSLIFMTPDGKTLDTVKGYGKDTIKFPDFPSSFDASVMAAMEQCRRSLQVSLAKSQPLAALADARKGGAPAAARAAPPAPAPVASGPSLPAPIAPNFGSPARPDDLAVIVGIESYSDIATKAPYAERDAEAFKAYVRALGVPERNVVLLKGPKAGKASIEKYVQTWLPQLAKADGRVYFYFSGHGAPDVKTGKAYLVPWDGDPNFLENTAVPLDKLYASLGALPSRHVLVAMDSCFSGAGGRSVMASGARPLVTKVDVGAAPAKLTVLSASAASEISGSLDDKGHGAFTYYLLDGLNAGARTPKVLLDRLVPEVQDEARRLNRSQTPELHGDGAWSLR